MTPSRFSTAGVSAVFASFAIIACMFLLSGCAGEPDDPATLRLALRAAPNQLDPALVVDVAGGEICSQIFQGLVRFDVEGRLVPALASSWSVEAGGTRYVFRLHPGMNFSSGRPVVASDVVFSFERVLAPASRSSRQWVLERIRGARDFASGAALSIDGLSAPDDSTVVIELDEPSGPFLSLLALPAAMVVPREALTAIPAGAAASGSEFRTFGGLPFGSGQWRLAVWERGDYLLLETNPHHPESPRGVTAVRYRIIPESFTQVAEFESGALDVLNVPLAELDHFRRGERYRGLVQERTELRVYYIGLNNRRPPFDDPDVRRALNGAINVERMIDVLTSGTAIRSSGAIPPSLPGYAGRDPYPYDPAAARELLASRGYPEGFSMEIWLRDSPEGNRMLEAVQGYLAESGVDVRLVRREWSAFKEAVSAGKVDAFFLDWVADYASPENFVYPLFHSQNAGGGGNRAFFADPEIDAMIERAGRSVDAEAAAALYGRIDGEIYGRAPWIYLYHPVAFQAVSPLVRGYRMPAVYLGADYSTVVKQTR